jgi:hypothetical protein
MLDHSIVRHPHSVIRTPQDAHGAGILRRKLRRSAAGPSVPRKHGGPCSPSRGARESRLHGQPARDPGNPQETTDETPCGGPKAFLTACARPQPGVRVVAGFLDEQVSSSRSESWCSRSSLFPGGTASAIDPCRTATRRAGGTFRGRHLLLPDHEIPGEPPSATFAEPSTPSIHSQIAGSSRHSARATGHAGSPESLGATSPRAIGYVSPSHKRREPGC